MPLNAGANVLVFLAGPPNFGRGAVVQVQEQAKETQSPPVSDSEANLASQNQAAAPQKNSTSHSIVLQA